ncbi:hypothetical protein OQH60_05905 [Campylobacter sp. MIT 21-1685]|uniref:hypothetical protein n=1 Tax=unclassified Campylobacter TaxID=2593542 RepID=UPI00224A61C7|nr:MULTISPECIES: hypothetical protein [unclassified Campylobacter]MCX2683395.1 hypothetical protein [Campylobacter sp. MIT 21-1684]MCX2751678.1 hypothetical protein [Campylobacter sp. MIT 21-1682]MCX2807879.1 hypothetical protein [Campylobacter sp. MIT 21-1685]
MTQERMKFLEFIQNVITRMNTNSSQMKTICITIISALFAVYAANQNKYIIFVVFIPLCLCCLLDMYYLWQERKFRDFYAEVIKEQSIIKDFDFSSFENYQKGFLSYIKVFLSHSIWLFYGLVGGCSFLLWSVL